MEGEKRWAGGWAGLERAKGEVCHCRRAWSGVRKRLGRWGRGLGLPGGNGFAFDGLPGIS